MGTAILFGRPSLKAHGSWCRQHDLLLHVACLPFLLLSFADADARTQQLEQGCQKEGAAAHHSRKSIDPQADPAGPARRLVGGPARPNGERQAFGSLGLGRIAGLGNR